MTTWADSEHLKTKDASWLTKRLTEEMKKLAKARQGGKGRK